MHLFFFAQVNKIRVNEADQDARADEKFLPRPDWNGSRCVSACVVDWQATERPTDLPDFVSGQRPVAVGRVPVGRARQRGLVLRRVRVSLVRPQTHVVLDAGVVLVLVRHFTPAISISARVALRAQEQTPSHLTRSSSTWSVLALGYLEEELPSSVKKGGTTANTRALRTPPVVKHSTQNAWKRATAGT